VITIINYIIGVLFISLSIYCIVTNKIPLAGKYQGVKNITCHVRLEAGAIGIVGFLIIIAKIFELEFGVMIGLIAFVCIVTLILEIITKTV